MNILQFPRDPARGRRIAGRTGPELSIASLAFPASDGFPLTGSLIENPQGSGPVVLVSSAAAVRQDFYRPFAEALCAAGARAALTYDYRGVGASSAPEGWTDRLSMKDWGAQDMAAAARSLVERFPGHPLAGIGQSFGGSLFGLSGVDHLFVRYAMIASGDGYLPNTDEPLKLFLRMTLLGLPIATVLGHMPGWLGLGETVPASIFRDWARWCRRKGYMFEDRAVPEAVRFAQVRTPLLAVGIADDRWSTPRAVNALLDRMPNARQSQIWLNPAEAGCASIGHLGFFKPKFAATLWQPVIHWLLNGRLRLCEMGTAA